MYWCSDTKDPAMYEFHIFKPDSLNQSCIHCIMLPSFDRMGKSRQANISSGLYWCISSSCKIVCFD